MEIDYVVPMVFPDDPLWREDFRRCNSRYQDGHVRWRSWGLERLHIQLVRKNMPWLRNIFVILARESQKQSWMDEENVKVVFHKDFIPDRFLPLFNSCSIELFLPYIPGLSEHFIYANDDMFTVAPLTEDDFFCDGLPMISIMEKKLPRERSLFHRICIRSLNFVAAMFGRYYGDTWLWTGHSLSPILKSTCDKLWEKRYEMEKAVHSFRHEEDMIQYIFTWYQYLSGEYSDSSIDMVYASAEDSTDELREKIRSCKGVICINDNERCNDIEPYIQAAREELTKHLGKWKRKKKS